MTDVDFVKLGYNAAQQIASRVNAGNANEFAATSISGEINRMTLNSKINPVLLIRLQNRCHLDLSPLLLLEDKEQIKALALFGGGAMQFYQDNPD
jgi:hypothetical protein